ncbi:MAG: type II secretion system F family protein, partial [Planctomycetaceae bacterium]|nr:type II secretion system F family protein [Planctomycetaceae bacterium]
MATFVYEAMNNVGQPEKGEIEAPTSAEAIGKIRAKGFFPTTIKEKAGAAKKKGATAGGKGETKGRGLNITIGGGGNRVGRVSSKLLTQMTRQLSTLIEAGLPILRSLRILEEQQKPGSLRVALRMVGDDVESGTTLSEAMARHPKAFTALYTNMIRAGELGGVLEVVLKRLADFMEKSEALKKKVVSAMIYPAAVITFSVLIVTMIMIVVVPKFQDIFTKMGKNLPLITEILITASKFVVNGGWAIILLSPLAIWGALKLIRSSAGGALALDSVKLRIPIMGTIVSKTSVARFARTLGTLLSAGVPILEALNITRSTCGNMVFANALGKVHDGIREGESFAEPLRHTKVVEPMVVNMIDVGEETGELDNMLERVADNYDEDVDNIVSGMVSL